MAELTGTVFDIQRYSVKDGPGIRTVVFLKGCPLRCVWCENPESLSIKPQLGFQARDCIRCGACAEQCPLAALDLDRAQRVDYERCDDCGLCVAPCPSEALRMIGKPMGVAEVVTEVLRDRPFYERSGGGVTLSGGEPTMQHAFCLALLQRFKREGLHTVIETSGLLSWERLRPIIEHVDLLYYDLKGVLPRAHKSNTGVDNSLIQENARKLAALGKAIVFRLVMVPGHNADNEHLTELDRFLTEVSADEVHVLPYHDHGEAKLATIRPRQQSLGLQSMPSQEAEQIAAKLRTDTRRVVIGGG